jgi:hypothetical protein
MASIIDALRAVKDRARGTYANFEGRLLAGPAGRWTPRRRWVVAVLAPALALLCCCLPTAFPLIWLAKSTVEAGRGAPSAVAAANLYLLALGYDEDDGLLPVLDDERQDQLLEQWRAYRTAMQATPGGGPNRLDLARFQPEHASDRRTVVAVDVSATWWGRGGTAGTSLRSQPRTWRITTRDDDGWRVTHVDAPPWCGPGGYLPQCGPTPSPSPPSTSASPSYDPLQHPREMLRCGPRDPFRQRHSCPPTPVQS